MIKRATAALLLVCCLLCALPAGAQMQKFSTYFMDSFDTVTTLIGYCEDQETFDTWAQAAHDMMLYLHKLYDKYNSYEDEGIVNIHTLNQRAAAEPVPVDDLLFSLLSFAKSNYALCQDQTNIAMGSVLSIWHDYREMGLSDPANASLPPMELLESAQAHTSIDDLVLDPENKTVYFADPQLQLDVGAVAKGYAAEIVAKALLSSDMPSFILSAGGNVRVGDKPQDGRKAWGIGIQDPDGALLNTSDIVETFFISNVSVVTSGDYQRYYTVDGKNYHHLIDPDTLMPGDHFRAVSILTEDSGLADMLSTAAYLMPYEESRAFVESLDGVEALWILPDGSIEMTDGAYVLSRTGGATSK
ncbi:MAG: FAD:protein FMN transferase [Clostridia bacterium]|nr:FAD:protein FMN transferase [Clostridia bacterium]